MESHGKTVKCRDCINSDFITVYSGYPFCPETSFLIEDLDEPILCSSFVPRDTKDLSDKERYLLDYLKTFNSSEITVLSIPPTLRGSIGKLRSKGIISISSSWIKTSNSDYKKIKTIRINRRI